MVAMVLATVTVIFRPVPSAASTPALGDVTMTVDDVSPNTPKVTYTPSPLTFTLTLTNATAQTLRGLTVHAERGDPIGTQSALDSAIADPRPPSPDLSAPLATTVRTSLTGFGSQTITFRTTTDVPGDNNGVCLCHNLIYPFWFTADYTASDGTTTTLATAQTYVPSFVSAPTKSTVAWVWPLLDRPHRLAHSRLFTDDDLAAEVAPGGRLDQLLQVVENVAGKVPLTLVTDPDLIDELVVMSQGYQVATTDGPVVGTGGEDARLWLQRLSEVLANHPDLELDFTPSADPAVESLTRNDLSWSTALDPAVQERMSQAIGVGTVQSDIVWPVNERVTPPTLRALIDKGADTVLLNDRALTAGPRVAADTDALAPLRARNGHALAAVTSSPLQRWVQAVLNPDGHGLALLPQLVAELAIRVVTDNSHFVVLAPPRNLEVNPGVATQAILATADTTWSRPIGLRDATLSVAPVPHGALRHRARLPQLPPRTVDSLLYVTESLPNLGSLYSDPADARAALGGFPAAIQRVESSSLLDDRERSMHLAAFLERSVRYLRNGVYLVPPSDGTYTLTSKNSELPVTVVNRLAAPISVKLTVTTVSGVPGFTAGFARDRTIDIKPNSKVQLKVPTHVDRVGLIDVRVQLTTPTGLSLGSPIRLTVRSTTLGTVGIVITAAAAILLAIAVLLRQVRRVRRRVPDNPPPGDGPRHAAGPPPPSPPDPTSGPPPGPPSGPAPEPASSSSVAPR
jgi:hypothetical protein